MRRRQERRPVSDSRRPAYITARISERSRHSLEVLSLVHRESLSSVIERAIEELTNLEVDRFGAWLDVSWDEAEGFQGTNIAHATWAPEDWLRKLKMSLLVPKKLFTPAEEKFWSGIVQGRDRFWLAADPATLTKDARKRLGEHVLKIGVPNEPAIQEAWEKFQRDSTGGGEPPEIQPSLVRRAGGNSAR